MSCRKFEEELEKWGSLIALETDPAFVGHLKACPVCQSRRSEYAQFLTLLEADQPPQPDETYWASFPALVRERIEKAWPLPLWKPLLAWGLPVVAMLLVVGIALFTSKERPDLTNLTTEEAFNFNGQLSENFAEFPLPENAVSSVTAQAEEELVGTLKIEELVYTLSDEQLKTLEEKLTDFKL